MLVLTCNWTSTFHFPCSYLFSLFSKLSVYLALLVQKYSKFTISFSSGLFVTLSFASMQYCHVLIWHVWKGASIQEVWEGFFYILNFRFYHLQFKQHYADCGFFLPVSISWFQSICIFQFTYPKGTCKSHKEWYKCSTPHRCIERGQHFLLLLLSTSNGSFCFLIQILFWSYIWLAYADEFGILSYG